MRALVTASDWLSTAPRHASPLAKLDLRKAGHEPARKASF